MLLVYIQLFRLGVLEVHTYMKQQVVYFHRLGPNNTDMVHKILLEGHCFTKLRIF